MPKRLTNSRTSSLSFDNDSKHAGSAMIDSQLKELALRYIDSQGKDFRSFSQKQVIVLYQSSWLEEPEDTGHTAACIRTEKSASPRPSGYGSLPSPSSAASLPLIRRLKKAIASPDESFTESLLRLIREKGMSHAECYHRANIDRRLFSKIQSDLHYRPKKQTALAFAIALRLNVEETSSLLKKAGFALSDSDRFDLAVKYCLRDGIDDILLINELLLELDLPLLGA